jgi:hypothetical protein
VAGGGGCDFRWEDQVMALRAFKGTRGAASVAIGTLLLGAMQATPRLRADRWLPVDSGKSALGALRFRGTPVHRVRLQRSHIGRRAKAPITSTCMLQDSKRVVFLPPVLSVGISFLVFLPCVRVCRGAVCRQAGPPRLPHFCARRRRVLLARLVSVYCAARPVGGWCWCAVFFLTFINVLALSLLAGERTS